MPKQSFINWITAGYHVLKFRFSKKATKFETKFEIVSNLCDLVRMSKLYMIAAYEEILKSSSMGRNIVVKTYFKDLETPGA